MSEKKTERKISSFFKKIQGRIHGSSNEDIKDDTFNDPTITQHNFGNINLYKNELNIKE